MFELEQPRVDEQFDVPDDGSARKAGIFGHSPVRRPTFAVVIGIVGKLDENEFGVGGRAVLGEGPYDRSEAHDGVLTLPVLAESYAGGRTSSKGQRLGWTIR